MIETWIEDHAPYTYIYRVWDGVFYKYMVTVNGLLLIEKRAWIDGEMVMKSRLAFTRDTLMTAMQELCNQHLLHPRIADHLYVDTKGQLYIAGLHHIWNLKTTPFEIFNYVRNEPREVYDQEFLDGIDQICHKQRLPLLTEIERRHLLFLLYQDGYCTTAPSPNELDL